MSGEGFGQPQIANWTEFNVTELNVLETNAPPGTMNIIDANEAFTLEFKFELKGSGWNFNVLDRASIQFRAESIGSGPEYYLGEKCVPLVSGNPPEMPPLGEYTVEHNVTAGIPLSRVYRLSAVIVLESLNVPSDDINDPTVATTPKYGHVGFYEGALLQVHVAEENN